MTEGFAELFSAAGAHVKAVGDESGLERGPGHADDVSRVAAAFKPVEQDDLADGFCCRARRLDEDLGVEVGAEEVVFENLPVGGIVV